MFHNPYFPVTKRRSYLEIKAKVLEILNKQDSRLLHIMNNANLTYKLFHRLIKQLQQAGLVEIRLYQRTFTSSTITYYCITEKGKDVYMRIRDLDVLMRND